MSKTLHTKFGTAYVNNTGYYQIDSRDSKFDKKLLHRLIFEDFYGVKLPSEIIIHHIDKNKKNNCILNLEPMTRAEHNTLHNSGENHPNYGKKADEKLLKKLSESHKGIRQSLDTKLKNSKSKNTTGIFRVGKHKRKSVDQGFTWSYKYYENGVQCEIERVNLEDLEKEVKSRGLEWIYLGDEL